MSWRKGEPINRTRWRAIRLKALDRDNWTCVICGRKGRLEVDHVVPLEVDQSKAYDLSNTQTLCRICHFAKTRSERPAKTDTPEQLAWREFMNTRLHDSV